MECFDKICFFLQKKHTKHNSCRFAWYVMNTNQIFAVAKLKCFIYHARFFGREYENLISLWLVPRVSFKNQIKLSLSFGCQN